MGLIWLCKHFLNIIVNLIVNSFFISFQRYIVNIDTRSFIVIELFTFVPKVALKVAISVWFATFMNSSIFGWCQIERTLIFQEVKWETSWVSEVHSFNIIISLWIWESFHGHDIYSEWKSILGLCFSRERERERERERSKGHILTFSNGSNW